MHPSTHQESEDSNNLTNIIYHELSFPFADRNDDNENLLFYPTNSTTTTTTTTNNTDIQTFSLPIREYHGNMPSSSSSTTTSSVQYNHHSPQTFFLPQNFYESPEFQSSNNLYSTHQRTPSLAPQLGSDEATPDSSTPDTCYSQCSDAQECADRNCVEVAEYDIVECTEPSCPVGSSACGGDMPTEAVKAATYLQSAPYINNFHFGHPSQEYIDFNPINALGDDYIQWENTSIAQNHTHDSIFDYPLLSHDNYIAQDVQDIDQRAKRRRGDGSLDVHTSISGQSMMGVSPLNSRYNSAACLWQDCNQVYENSISRDGHVHEDHYHSQLKLACTQHDCNEFSGVDLPTHLKRKHDYMMRDDLCQYPNCSFDPNGNDNLGLEQHVDQKHSVPVGDSLFCGWKDCNFNDLDTPQELADHLREKHKVLVWAPHECRWKNGNVVCGQRFQSPKDLQEHTKRKHLAHLSTKDGGYICRWDGCDRARKQEEKKQGEKEIGGKKKPGEKKQEGSFAQRGKLERHMQSHTKYKAAMCTICGNEFSGEQSLEQHMRIHNGQKPYICDFENCEKAFAQASALTMHKRTHTGEKPLECEICGKRFAESSNLSKHRKTHNIVGKYACREENCGKTFHREEQLRKHQKQHEKQKQALKG